MINMLSNSHTHTRFCDGKNTAEEMVLRALELGFTDIGFSGHSPVPFDDYASMSTENYLSYCSEINSLKGKYKGEINISLGLEVEYYSEADTSDLDYTIGALHFIHIPKSEKYCTFDDTHEAMQSGINEFSDGDVYEFIYKYYRIMSDIPKRLNPDIIAHFDLITKLNKDNRYFDEESKKYKNLALESLDSIAKTDCIIEVNTGGMFRGYTEKPYPAPFLLKRLAELNHPIMLSSDAHCTDALNYKFKESLELIKRCGFKSIYALKNNEFKEIGITA